MSSSLTGGVPDTNDAAFWNNEKAYAVGQDKEQVRDHYDHWVSRYESDLSPDHYTGPAIVSKYAESHFHDNKSSVVILDVAAGTGFVGEELVRRGFKNIEALEPSLKMIEKAKDKHIYSRFHCHFLTEKALPIPEKTYDCVVSSGGFGNGHIPCEAFHELVRLTKQGGMIVVVIKERSFYAEQYQGKLEPLIEELQQQGKWEKIEHKKVENYVFKEPGILLVFKVLQ